MDFSKILPAIETVAPTIAGMLLGPVGSMGVQAIESVFGLAPGTADSNPDAVVQAVQNMTPEQAVKLAEINANLKIQLTQAGIDPLRIAADNTASARKMQSETHDPTPRILAVIVFTAFFGLLGYMLVYGLPKGTGDSQTFSLLLGTIVAAVGAIINFYFGSSSGSAKKDETIKRMAR